MARQQFGHFEPMKQAASDNLYQVKNSLWTNWRNPIQMRDRYTDLDQLNLRQQLGSISSQEISEVNRVLNMGFYGKLSRDKREPCKLMSNGGMMTNVLLAAGAGFTAYGRLVLKSNMVWFLAAPLPALIYVVVNNKRQDSEHI